MHIVVIHVPSGLHTDDVRLDCTCAYNRDVVPINASDKTKVEQAITSTVTRRCTFYNYKGMVINVKSCC